MSTTKPSINSILQASNWQQLISEMYPGCDLSFWAKRRDRVLTGVKSKSFGKQPKDRKQQKSSPESILWQIETDFVTTISRDGCVSYADGVR